MPLTDQFTGPEDFFLTSNLFTLAASATDIGALFGSASKLVQVRKIRLWLYGSAAFPPAVQVSIITRATQNTGGTTGGATIAKDPAGYKDASTAALAAIYTANPTVGTGLATIRTFFAYPGSTNATPTTPHEGAYEIDFTGQLLATRLSKTGGDLQLAEDPIILRDVNHGITVNLNGNTITGGQAVLEFDWRELLVL